MGEAPLDGVSLDKYVSDTLRKVAPCSKAVGVRVGKRNS